MSDLLARLDSPHRTRDAKEAALLIRALMQQNAEMAVAAKGLLESLAELAAIARPTPDA